jgi:superfamily II DNA or RNA helicase
MSKEAMMSFDLRPYQKQAIDNLRRALVELQRLCLYSPTGSGKTEIAIALILLALAKGKRVVFLVNRIELCVQASRRFHLAGIEHGIIQGEHSTNVSAQVIIASIHTVARRGLSDFDLIIIDEAHSVPGSKAYRELLFKLNNVPVIGLTATPFSRGMGKAYKELGGPLFEKLVSAATIRELIDLKHLVDVEVYAPSEPDLHGVKIVAGDYSEKELGEAVDKPDLVGDIVSHWKRLADGTSTVVFATNQAHSRHIVEQFLSIGVSAEHIDCYTPDDERQTILERVRTGQTMVISNVGILAEGWDFPACKTMVLARPTRSICRYIQMAGRVLRPYPGKESAMILDHSGTVARLGFPTDDLPLILDDGKPNKSSQAQRNDPLPKKCTACHFMKPAKTHACPACGFAPEKQCDVVVGSGELVKLERKKPLKKESGQFIYSQLLGYAQKKGFKAGWAFHKFREFTGREARGLRQVAAEPTPEILGWIKSRVIANAKRNEATYANR